MKELTLEILEDAIRAVEEARGRPIVQIYLNPDDWHKATEQMEKFAIGSGITTAFGIPVIVDERIPHNVFILRYDTAGGAQLVGWRIKL